MADYFQCEGCGKTWPPKAEPPLRHNDCPNRGDGKPAPFIYPQFPIFRPTPFVNMDVP